MGISLEGVLKDGNDQVNQHGRNIIISLLKGMKLLKQQFWIVQSRFKLGVNKSLVFNNRD